MSAWDNVVQKVRPHLVKIETQDGMGTGFVCALNELGLCGVATANHVIEESEEWQKPIRIHTHDFAHTFFLAEGDRVIFSKKENDSAVVLFNPGDFKFPKPPIALRPIDLPLVIGSEVGWLGFPHIESKTLCFFAGNISAAKPDRRAYLIDGVAINGVSGGPVMYSSDADGVQIIGIVTQYRPNRIEGGPLPGLLVAQDVTHFHQVVEKFKTMDEASKKKTEIEGQKQQEQPSKTNLNFDLLPPE